MRIIVMSVVGTEAFGVGDVERSWIVVLLGELCSEAAPVLAVMSVIVLFCCNVDVTLELMLMPDLIIPLLTAAGIDAEAEVGFGSEEDRFTNVDVEQVRS